VDYVQQKNPDLLWKNNRGNDYGDWLNADTLKLEGWPTSGAKVPKEVFATMFFARSTELVARMADVLGRRDDAEHYRVLARDIRAAFNRAYVAADSRIQGNTLAGYAIALAFDLLPESQRSAATLYLLEGFQTYGGRISTGFHSTICLMNELTRRGRSDEAYRLINNREMPSWGYAIDHGATTVWERWDGYVEGRGFQDPGMNSFSHYAIGSVGEWMYRTIIGINPDESKPGYKHFFIRPRPGGGLTWARGEYHSLHGRIECAWRKADGRLTINLTVPPNTTATVSMPTSDPAGVTEDGRPASRAKDVKFLGAEGGAARYFVPAGQYTFSAASDEQGPGK
jgi:alpha-L-rhamnosidase